MSTSSWTTTAPHKTPLVRNCFAKRPRFHVHFTPTYSVGLVIGEALTLSTNQRSVSSLSLLPCQSTYSCSSAGAFALEYAQSRPNIDPISAPLAVASRLTRQPIRKLSDDFLSTALTLVTGLAENTIDSARPSVPGFVGEACRELQLHGEVNRTWNLLDGRFGFPRQFVNEMRGQREHRIRTFERILKEANQLDVLTSSFLGASWPTRLLLVRSRTSIWWCPTSISI
jgi:hypothetical protein